MRTAPSPLRWARGMVLLEVIIALSIFTAVAFSLVMALDAATEAAADRNYIDEATLGLENQMAQLSSGHLDEERRDLPADGSGINYHLDVGPEILRDARQRVFNGFYRTTLRASWRANGQTETRDLSQLVYQP